MPPVDKRLLGRLQQHDALLLLSQDRQEQWRFDLLLRRTAVKKILFGNIHSNAPLRQLNLLLTDEKIVIASAGSELVGAIKCPVSVVSGVGYLALSLSHLSHSFPALTPIRSTGIEGRGLAFRRSGTGAGATINFDFPQDLLYDIKPEELTMATNPTAASKPTRSRKKAMPPLVGEIKPKRVRKPKVAPVSADETLTTDLAIGFTPAAASIAPLAPAPAAGVLPVVGIDHIASDLLPRLAEPAPELWLDRTLTAAAVHVPTVAELEEKLRQIMPQRQDYHSQLDNIEATIKLLNAQLLDPIVRGMLAARIACEDGQPQIRLEAAVISTRQLG